jgi:hypothetical protein
VCVECKKWFAIKSGPTSHPNGHSWARMECPLRARTLRLKSAMSALAPRATHRSAACDSIYACTLAQNVMSRQRRLGAGAMASRAHRPGISNQSRQRSCPTARLAQQVFAEDLRLFFASEIANYGATDDGYGSTTASPTIEPRGS